MIPQSVFVLWQFQKESIFDPKEGQGVVKIKKKSNSCFSSKNYPLYQELAHLEMFLGFVHKIPRVIHIINTTGPIG